MYDFCIIGAGVVGSHIARELSRYEVQSCILEKAGDVSEGASKANSGIIHGGYAAKHGTLKGTFNIKGNRLFQQLENELNFGYRKTGGLVLGFDENDYTALIKLYENGKKNGVSNLKVIERDEILSMEPAVNSNGRYALYSEEIGVTSPYEYNIALAENAVANGVKLFLNSEVVSIHRENNFYCLETPEKQIKTKCVINAAGIYADKISRMAGVDNFSITPRKGQYILFQKGTGRIVKRVIFQIPTVKGKGILVTSTYHGNLLLGPNSEEIEDRETTRTDDETLDYIMETASKSIPDLDPGPILKTFSGIRPAPSTGDFIVREEMPGFINAAGIETPGLTSSPAIARMVVDLIKKHRELRLNKSFNPYRKPIIIPKALADEEVKRRIALKASPEKIICRCEQVTEGEILDALHRNIPVNTVYGVKKRTRAGMGKCQGRFCGPRVREIIDREMKGANTPG